MGVIDELAKGLAGNFSRNMFFNMANQFVTQGRYLEAINAYQQAIAADPNYLEAHFNLGFLLMNMGNYAQAIPHFQQVNRQFPNHAESHNNLGYCLEGMGQLQEAAAEYNVSLQLKFHPTPQANLQRVMARIQMATAPQVPLPGQVPGLNAQGAPQVIIKETIREIVKMPCKYCGTLIEITSTKCTNCGAPLK